MPAWAGSLIWRHDTDGRRFAPDAHKHTAHMQPGRLLSRQTTDVSHITDFKHVA
jgi:hypothetical protein